MNTSKGSVPQYLSRIKYQLMLEVLFLVDFGSKLIFEDRSFFHL